MGTSNKYQARQVNGWRARSKCIAKYVYVYVEGKGREFVRYKNQGHSKRDKLGSDKNRSMILVLNLDIYPIKSILQSLA